MAFGSLEGVPITLILYYSPYLFHCCLYIPDYGYFKVDCKTKTESGVKFTTKGSHSTDTGKMNGELETEYKFDDYGKIKSCFR